MPVADKLIMLKMAVRWVSLAFPEGGVTVTLSTYHEHMKPGSMALYLAAPDILASHDELVSKGVQASEVKDDLYGPGSGVKWFNLTDPEGNLIFLVQS